MNDPLSTLLHFLLHLELQMQKFGLPQGLFNVALVVLNLYDLGQANVVVL